MIILIVLVIILYIIPMIVNLWWTLAAHSKNGRYSKFKPTSFDWQIVFIPILNIIGTIYIIDESESPYDSQ